MTYDVCHNLSHKMVLYFQVYHVFFRGTGIPPQDILLVWRIYIHLKMKVLFHIPRYLREQLSHLQELTIYQTVYLFPFTKLRFIDTLITKKKNVKI